MDPDVACSNQINNLHKKQYHAKISLSFWALPKIFLPVSLFKPRSLSISCVFCPSDNSNWRNVIQVQPMHIFGPSISWDIWKLVLEKNSQRIINVESRAGQRIFKGYSPGSSRKFEVLLLPEEPCVLDDLPPAKLFRLLIAKSVRVEGEGNFQSLDELLYPR